MTHVNANPNNVAQPGWADGLLKPAPRALLFDLDGTLLDTAPDMIGALNALRAEHGLPPGDSTHLRQFVSKGSIGLLGAGMPACDQAQTDQWKSRFLDLYSQDLSGRTGLFDGMEQIIDVARDRGIALGIVTNKPGFLTDPLLCQLGLDQYFGSIISGDTLAKAKPDPGPVLLACQQLEIEPHQAWFVGDDERDIIAGRAAGCPTVAATYGYVLPDQDIGSWGADGEIHRALDLLELMPA